MQVVWSYQVNLLLKLFGSFFALLYFKLKFPFHSRIVTIVLHLILKTINQFLLKCFKNND